MTAWSSLSRLGESCDMRNIQVVCWNQLDQKEKNLFLAAIATTFQLPKTNSEFCMGITLPSSLVTTYSPPCPLGLLRHPCAKWRRGTLRFVPCPVRASRLWRSCVTKWLKMAQNDSRKWKIGDKRVLRRHFVVHSCEKKRQNDMKEKRAIKDHVGQGLSSVVL